MEELKYSIPTDPVEQVKEWNSFTPLIVKSFNLDLSFFFGFYKKIKDSKYVVNKNQNCPKLRFPGFTEPWVKGQVSNIFDELRKGTLDIVSVLNKVKSDEFKYPIYSAQVSNEGICGYSDTYSFEDCITWTSHGENSGTVFYREGKFEATGLCGIAISHKGYANKAIAEILNRVAYRYASGAGIPQVSMATFKQIVITYPLELSEQQKIGNFFKDIDDLTKSISLESTYLQNLKKGVIQGLLPDKEGVIKIRSKKYNNSWDESKLESLATFKKGKGYSKGDLKDEGHPIILYGQLYTNYEIVISKTSYTDLKEKSVLSKGNEVIIPASGESAIDIAVASVVKEQNVILGGDINILTPKEKLLDPIFLAIALSNGKQRRELAKFAQGSIIIHLYNEHLKKLKVQYPSLSEQQEIASLICKLAELHVRKEKLLAMIAQFKKALLQRMFV